MAVALGQLGQRVRSLAQAFERRDRGEKLDQKMVGRLQVRVRERNARIGRMQVAALAAPELAKLGTERGERMAETIGAAPRPRPAQHRALECSNGARMGIFWRTEPHQRMLEQRQQRNRREPFDRGFGGKPREHAGGRVGERVAA